MTDDIDEITFQPGQVLFHENEQSFHFFIIQEGEIEVYKSGPGGQKVPLAVVGPGTSIGEFAMIDKLPRSATAKAKTKVRVARVSDEAYQQLISELPDWAVSVMKALVERLRSTNEIVRQMMTDPKMRQRLDAVEFDSDGNVENE